MYTHRSSAEHMHFSSPWARYGWRTLVKIYLSWLFFTAVWALLAKSLPHMNSVPFLPYPVDVTARRVLAVIVRSGLNVGSSARTYSIHYVKESLLYSGGMRCRKYIRVIVQPCKTYDSWLFDHEITWGKPYDHKSRLTDWFHILFLWSDLAIPSWRNVFPGLLSDRCVWFKRELLYANTQRVRST